MRNFITIKTEWTTPWGNTFPADTVFFRGRTSRKGRTQYSYATPGGGEGWIALESDQSPGN
jgi:hypothetical protein